MGSKLATRCGSATCRAVGVRQADDPEKEASQGVRIVFMGTPEFAAPVLRALVDAGHEVAAVYTRPDRRAGRGNRLAAPPVKRAALEMGLSVRQPASLRRDEEAQREIRKLAPDVDRGGEPMGYSCRPTR